MLHLLPEAQGRADAVNKRDRFEREFGFSDDLDEVDALRALKCAQPSPRAPHRDPHTHASWRRSGRRGALTAGSPSGA